MTTDAQGFAIDGPEPDSGIVVDSWAEVLAEMTARDVDTSEWPTYDGSTYVDVEVYTSTGGVVYVEGKPAS